jgi:transposase-like protein
VRRVLQTGLEVEMSGHLGYDRPAAEGRGSGNSRNGSSWLERECLCGTTTYEQHAAECQICYD